MRGVRGQGMHTPTYYSVHENGTHTGEGGVIVYTATTETRAPCFHAHDTSLIHLLHDTPTS